MATKTANRNSAKGESVVPDRDGSTKNNVLDSMNPK